MFGMLWVIHTVITNFNKSIYLIINNINIFNINYVYNDYKQIMLVVGWSRRIKKVTGWRGRV